MWKYFDEVIKTSRKNYKLRDKNRSAYLKEHLQVCAAKNTSKAPLSAYGSSLPPEIDSTRYKYKFKNLVLAGGGARSIAYCGVARALENHGILFDIQRFAGTGDGAIVAALLSLGFNSYDVEKVMDVNIDGLHRDSWNISKIPNVKRHFGCHPAEKFKKFMGDVFAIKTNNPDINFHQVFTKFGKELCIVVPNANTKSEEYFHVKTTPYVPIRDAVRMSISIPVEFKRVIYNMFDDISLCDYGGVACNYPIHCFDGWYLSMDDIQSETYMDPFKCKTTNLETLGCLVYSEDQHHTYRDDLEIKCSVKVKKSELPDTELSRRRQNELKYEELTNFYLQCIKDQIALINIFHQRCKGKLTFSFTEIEQILNKCRPAKSFADKIYGVGANAKMTYEDIKKSDTSKVTGNEVLEFNDELRSWLLQKYKALTLERNEVDGYKKDDVARTVGINTYYINASDFAMENGDRMFLIEQGKLSTDNFLKKCAHERELQFEADLNSRKRVSKTSLTEQELAKIKRFQRKSVLSFICGIVC